MPLPVAAIRKALGQAIGGRETAKLSHNLRFPKGERVPTTLGGEVLGDFTVNRAPGMSASEGFKDGMNELGLDYSMKRGEALNETDPGEWESLPSFGDFLKEPVSPIGRGELAPRGSKYGRVDALSKQLDPFSEARPLEEVFVQQAKEVNNLVDHGYFNQDDVMRILRNGMNEEDMARYNSAWDDLRATQADEEAWRLKQSGGPLTFRDNLKYEDDIPY